MPPLNPGHRTFKSLYIDRDQISLEDFTALLNSTARFQGADHGYCIWLSEVVRSIFRAVLLRKNIPRCANLFWLSGTEWNVSRKNKCNQLLKLSRIQINFCLHWHEREHSISQALNAIEQALVSPCLYWNVEDTYNLWILQKQLARTLVIRVSKP